MNPALRRGLVCVFGRDDLTVEVELTGVREGGFFPHDFRTREDLVIEDDGTFRGKEEMVDETGGVLASRGGVGERDFDKLLGWLELDIDPLAIGVDGGEDLVGAEVILQFPVGEEAGGAAFSIGVFWVLNFCGDDAVHGVTVVAGVDGCRDVECFTEFDGVDDSGSGDGGAGGRGDELRRALCPDRCADGNLNGSGDCRRR